jgi:hypothetical protein
MERKCFSRMPLVLSSPLLEGFPEDFASAESGADPMGREKVTGIFFATATFTVASEALISLA